ncbi:MAG: hypothetical protein M0Z61_05200 [Nitrospiraceae bacterium]|nr:hypothetical protein [Nitrospiraceae bacterium]
MENTGLDINTELDIKSNRRSLKYSKQEMFKRILWGGFARLLFRFSPRVFFGWRSVLLRIFGAKIGRHVHIYSSADIYMPWNIEVGDWASIGEHTCIYNLGKVTIGARATISHRAHLCAGTHDYGKPSLPLLKLPIDIGDQVWICTDAFVGPGVSVGNSAVVGARSVVMKDVEPWAVVAGNPAKFIKKRVMGRC